MTKTLDVFWQRLHQVLLAFAERLCSADPTLVTNIHHVSNDSFLLRGFLTFSRSRHGGEIAIAIDVRGDGNRFRVDSDACTDDGQVIAAGPSAIVAQKLGHSNVQDEFEDWMREFERFLFESEAIILTAIARLT